MSEKFSVLLEKEQLIFSAAHFITFAGNICESIHGHNYRVRCEVTGELDENGYVVDFIALRDALETIVRQLDHKVLLATQSSRIEVQEQGNEVVATFEQRRWVFPERQLHVAAHRQYNGRINGQVHRGSINESR